MHQLIGNIVHVKKKICTKLRAILVMSKNNMYEVNGNIGHVKKNMGQLNGNIGHVKKKHGQT